MSRVYGSHDNGPAVKLNIPFRTRRCDAYLE